MKPQYMLSENMVSTVALYMILKKMMTPFEKWDAYKLGLIDKDGNKLRHAVTAKEKKSWDLLSKFVGNFKKILNKFIGKSQLAQYVSVAYLLRESFDYFYIEFNRENLNETLLNSINYTKQNEILSLINSLPVPSEKITEENFEYYVLLYTPRVEAIMEKNKKLFDI